MRYQRWITLFAIAAFSIVPGAGQQKMNSLIVYGSGFAFIVEEPDGWTSDIASAPKYRANILFRSIRSAPDSSIGTIRVRVSQKVDENTRGDLEQDMAGYREKYRDVQFDPLPLSNPTYAVFSKVFFVKGLFYEYVAYLNPGSSSKLYFSVALNTGAVPATEAEMLALRHVVRTLAVIGE